MKKIGSYVGISILFLLILVWGTSKLADHYVLSRWNTEDSAVVIIEEVLGIESDSGGQDEDWESERVTLRILYRNGLKEGTAEELEIVRLKDSRLLLMEGEEYLLLYDVFDDGTVQYSISDRYRLPAVVGFIMFACGMLAIIAGKSGIKALAGLFLSLLFLLGWFVPALRQVTPLCRSPFLP